MAHGIREFSSPAQQISVTSFLTDVEGNLDYFDRFVEISEVLSWSKDDPREPELAEGAALVFGGDALDKGIGDIRFTNTLLKLARKYPGRVDFLLGNRDVNKLRVPSELHDSCLQDEAVATDSSFPYWLKPADVVTPRKFLSTFGMENSRANRLRWMLKETMGSEGAFERRSTELAIVQGVAAEAISDEHVVASYLDQVTPGHPDSFVLRFLSQGKLLHRFGACLFVHGAVSDDNYGTVPGKAHRDPNLDKWIEDLNAWARGQVEEYASSEEYWMGKNTKERKAHALMDYGVPGGNGGQTVVYGRWGDGSSNPISQELKTFLEEAGISSILCGHTPVGSSPAVVMGRGITVISADTSYSDVGHRSEWGVDNRGQAVSEVLAFRDGRVRVHGRLEDGAEIDFEVNAPHQSGEDDVVGRAVGDGWVVRAKLKEGGGCVLARGVRPVQYRRVTRAELQSMIEQCASGAVDGKGSVDGG